MRRLHTRICDLFGIEVPIFAAGMGGVAMPPLATAVSRAGGLGMLGATFSTPSRLDAEIQEVRRGTPNPFGVGLMIPGDIPPVSANDKVPPFPDFLADLLPRVAGLPVIPPPTLTLELAKAQVAVAVEHRVPLLVLGLGTPDWALQQCRAAGIKVMSVVGTVKQARKVEALGVDAVIAQGSEGGGHVGQVSTLVLLRQVVKSVSIPVLAGGGIMDGAGIAAALTLGADGAWMGTRFAATAEATTPWEHKTKMVEADDRSTVVSRCYTGKPSRVLRNIYTDRWAGHEHEVLPMPWQRNRVEALVAPAKAAGMIDIANYPTGQGAAIIEDIPAAGDLVARLVEETIAAFDSVRHRVAYE
jgi:NAD(P)H-dependent flavin oxidoreductase YrpB (nitropropane dioxygenase family)